MKEKLINFETAELAKKKGFNWLCLSFYDNGILDENEENDLTDYNSDYWNLKNNYNVDLVENQWVSAPTQSLLQQWLRDFHQIVVEINVCKEFGWVWDLYKTSGDTINELHRGFIDTYEEALEAGLQEALNLLKDENKSKD